MKDYILLMHDDVPERGPNAESLDWLSYFDKLRESGCFVGGSAMGGGVCLKKGDPAPKVTEHVTGYIRVQAMSLDAAIELVQGNPVFEAGGTVEVRELPRT